MTAIMTRLRALGLTAEQFGRLTGKDPVTVRNWDKPRSGRGVQQTPPWAALLLDAWKANPDTLGSALAGDAGPRQRRGVDRQTLG